MSNRVRSFVAGLVSFAVFASVLVLAIRADGREATAATSNDGGAWLVDRSEGGASHIERTTLKPTVEAQIGSPREAISALQSSGVILMHNETLDEVVVVDSANALGTTRVAVPDSATVRTVPGGAVVFDASRSQLWRVDVGELVEGQIDANAPVLAENEPGRLLVGLQGTVAVLTESRLLWPSGPDEDPAEVDLPEGFQPEFVTMAADQAVMVQGDEWVVATRGGRRSVKLDQPISVLALQREAATWPRVGVTSRGGEVFYVDVSSGAVQELGEGANAVQTGQQPINHEGCIYTLGGEAGAMVFAALCATGENETETKPDLPADAQLRLVNGDVWIDSLDGSGYLVSKDLELEEIADFSDIFDDSDGEEDADGERVEERLDQSALDAGLTGADESNTETPQPPVAVDDEAATRLGRSVVVDVLANDSDPNGDVILVEDTSIEVLDGADLATITVPPSANSVQVAPKAEAGTVRFRYTIDDGTGLQASALVEVVILPLTQDNNRPPVTGLDRVFGALGSTASVNLLENDSDPDGDSMILKSVEDGDGVSVLSLHPDGTVQLALPSSGAQGEIELTYVVEDEWQAEQEGTLRVSLRLEDSNGAPDARNDAGVTQVNRSITLPLLANDVDPDNDPLFVVLEPRPVDGAAVPGFMSTSDAGEFLFRPTVAGIYVFEYTASDLKETNSAFVRIEVTEETENRAPVAVRDDVTLARNETRVVRALENDGDLDGDLVGVSDLGVNDDLDVVLIPGVGFSVSMKSSAGRVESFSYRLTDGELESEPTQVVVIRSDEAFDDAPPLLVDDTIRVRPGRTSRAFVLRNDFDPEGLPLVVVDAAAPAEVVASVGGNGAWLNVRPDEGQTLPVSVQYTAADAGGQVAAATLQLVMVREEEPNTPPVARVDVAFTLEDQPIAINVVANDSDPESDGVTVVAVPDSPLNGSAVVEPDGATIAYQPAPGFTGTDEFTYLLRDTEGGESVGLVRVGVMPKPGENRPPVAGDDINIFGPFEANGETVDLDVLTNDIDPDGDELTIMEVVSEGVDAARLIGSGSAIRYTLPESVPETTVISFVYRITDNRLGIDEATVQFTIEPTVDPLPPIASPDVTAEPVRAGESVSFDVLANDVDPDGDDALLRLVEIDGPLDAVIAGRSITLTAPAETIEVAYTIEDEDGLRDSSFLTIEVKENVPPVVQTDIVLGPFFTDEVIDPIELARWVTDEDDATEDLVFAGIAGAQGGLTRLDQNARDNRIVQFEPSPEFEGDGGFAFTVQDSVGNLVSGWVGIQLRGPSNRPPVPLEQQPVQIEAGIDLDFDVRTLFEDPDVDDVLTYAIESEPGNQLSLVGDAPIYQLQVPITAVSGETQFSIRGTDPEGESAVATVRVVINETTSGPPETGPIPEQRINQGERATLEPLQAATDTLGQGGLRVTSAVLTDPSAGTVTIGTDETTIIYVSSDVFSGTAVIDYTIADAREGEGGDANGNASVVVVGRPDAPTGVKAEAQGPNTVALTWRVPGENGGPIEGYRIRVNGGDIVDTNSTNPTFRFDDLTPGTTYTFEVIAVNEAGQSDLSDASLPVIPDEEPGPPGKPVVTFVDGEPGAVQVDWAASENRGSAISSYEVAVSLCATGVRTLGDVTSYKWTGLPDGSPCSFTVTAENQKGKSLVSSPSDTECAVDVPGAPAQPVAVRGDKEATVTWAVPANPDCEQPIGYEIIRLRNGAVDGTPTPVPFGTNEWRSAPLANGDNYSFQVRAQNRQDWGSESVASAVVVPCGEPLQTTAPNVVPGDRQITVTRTEDADPNGCAVTQYVLRVLGVGDVPLPGDGVIDESIQNGTGYTVSIAGVNEIGQGPFSAESETVVPFGLPGAPAQLLLPVGNVTQFGEADDNGSAILRYEFSGSARQNGLWNAAGGTLECVNNLGIACIPAGAGQQTPRTGCLQNAQTIDIEVWAVNAAGAGDRTTWTMNLAGCPSQPTIGATDGNAEYSVSWSRPAGTQIWVESNGSLDGPLGGTSKTYSGANNTNYAVSVWACNQYGCSESASRTVRPTAPNPTLTLSRSSDGFVGNTCTAGSNCRWVRGSGQNWPPGEEYWIACGNPVFVNTQTGFVEGSPTVNYADRFVAADGSISWTEANRICASNFAHDVRVWTSGGTSVTARVSAP